MSRRTNEGALGDTKSAVSGENKSTFATVKKIHDWEASGTRLDISAHWDPKPLHQRNDLHKMKPIGKKKNTTTSQWTQTSRTRDTQTLQEKQRYTKNWKTQTVKRDAQKSSTTKTCTTLMCTRVLVVTRINLTRASAFRLITHLFANRAQITCLHRKSFTYHMTPPEWCTTPHY